MRPEDLAWKPDALGHGARPDGVRVQWLGTAGFAIEHAETIESPIYSGRHTLEMRSGRYCSLDRSFGVADGAGSQVPLSRGAEVWPRWTVAFAKPDLAIALTSE